MILLDMPGQVKLGVKKFPTLLTRNSGREVKCQVHLETEGGYGFVGTVRTLQLVVLGYARRLYVRIVLLLVCEMLPTLLADKITD